MTEAEWLASTDPLPMLIYLRGVVTPEQRAANGSYISSGSQKLYVGPGDRINSGQCRRFILSCLERVRYIPHDEAAERAILAYREHAATGSLVSELRSACQKIFSEPTPGRFRLFHPLDTHRWTDDPLGAAHAASDCEYAIALAAASKSVAITTDGATQDDLFEWGFSGGPPDPQFRAAKTAERSIQAGLLREVMGPELEFVRPA